MKLNEQQRRMIYAALKLCEQSHDMETTKCEIPVGTASLDGLTITIQQGGDTITIKPAPGTVLEREAGGNGDGTTDKRATQRLFGTAMMAEALHVLGKFNQDKRILRMFWIVIRRAIRRGNITQAELESQLGKRASERLAQTMEEIRQACPPAPNATPRSIKPPKRGMKPTVSIDRRQNAAG